MLWLTLLSEPRFWPGCCADQGERGVGGCALVVVSALAATGHRDELKAHLHGALNLGWAVDELREALLQIGGYAGFSAAHEALDVLSEIATHD